MNELFYSVTAGLAGMMLLFVARSSFPSPDGSNPDSPEPGTVYLTPAFLGEGEQEIAFQEGVLFVGENRRASASRTIGVHFRRFPAQDGVDGPPVFYLPGGPGSTLDLSELNAPDGRELIRFFTSVGDLVIVDQRGNPDVRNAYTPDLWMNVRKQPLDRPGTESRLKAAYRNGFTKALRRWQKRGVDLFAYDVRHAVGDVDRLRRALGYDQVILRGNSFGSQWSFAYMKQHPEHVARAMLGGVEPLNHTYDRPKHVWAAHRRIIDLVESDPDLQPHLPEQGLVRVLRSRLNRLEDKPVSVDISSPTDGSTVSVTIGRYDMQRALKKFAPDYYTREGLESWPRFVLEMLDGEHKYLGYLTYRRRRSDRIPLIFPLMDNSLGITDDRDRSLRTDNARSMVGPINALYYATRDASPTPVVSDAFRTTLDVEVPVLMIQGDLDRSTPIENARYAHRKLPVSHLLHVKNGTHMAIREVRRHRPELTEDLRSFLRTGSFDGLPKAVPLPPPDFEPPRDTSMYEAASQKARIPE
jgi:pimeloyl-ACP methyl ester carboxylesterase